MIEKIKELEKIARKLDPSSKQRTNWEGQVLDYTGNFLDNIEHLPAFNTTAGDGSGLLEYPFQEGSREMETLIEVFKEHVDKPALNPASGGHLAYIPGGGIYPTALGDFLADVSNNYAGISFAGPGAVRMENMLLRWMCSLVGYSEKAMGNLTSGGSIANLIAIATARDSKNIEPEHIRNSVIYLTEQAHHSIQKAIRIAGLGRCPHRYIPMDDRYRMDCVALSKAIEDDRASGLNPFLIVGSAGTTDTGSVDPLDELATISENNGCWFHVDAAYGGFFMMAEEVKSLFKGIERSDSVTIDPHKGLFLAYGTGAVLIKDVQAMMETHYYRANYMQDVILLEEEPSPADLSPELTKHFRGVRMWLPLQLYGLKIFRAALSEKIWLCRYFYEKIKDLGFEVGPQPELSVCLYRFIPPVGDPHAFNSELVKMIREDGRVFLSSTTVDGIFWIRLAVLCFRTHLSTIETALDSLKKNRDILLERQL